MNIELRQFKDMNFDQQWQIANAVSVETKSQFGAEQKIVPVTPTDIIAKGIGMVALEKDVLVGYVGAARPIENGGYHFSQVGTLIVPANYRGLNVGSMLVEAITVAVTEHDNIPFAFSNQSSKASFLKAKFTEALPSELPPSAVSHFGNQALVYPRYNKIDAIHDTSVEAVS